jgi:hypothetical protein
MRLTESGLSTLKPANSGGEEVRTMKKYLVLLIGVLLSVTPIMAFAEDCVEVDVELTPTVGPDTCGVRWVEFSVEVTNCGAERAMVDFSAVLEVHPPFGVAPFKTHRPVGAGETVLFCHKFPVPHAVPAGTYEACLTATIGTASATDCASVILEEPPVCPSCTSSVTSGITPTTASVEDCVEVNVELTPTVGPDTCGVRWVEFSVEVTNCGAEPAMVDFSAVLQVQPPFGVAPFKTHWPVGAGQTVLFCHKFPVPRVVPAGTYEACLTATIGTASATDCASVTLEEPPMGPSSLSLGQNYPNPFNLETGLTFGLTQSSNVSLKVYNILGEEVRTLANGRYGPGTHALTWDARDGHGSIVPSGVYFYRLTADGQVATRKMSLLK